VLLTRILVIYLSFGVLPACGLLSSRRGQADRAIANAEVLLEVESHHWNDIVIYLMNGNQSQRLGTVLGVSSNRFVFPYHQIASGGKVRLRAYPVGGQGSFTSEDVLVQPGQWIKWTLESDLSRSSMAVH
jgi:hypothetical protein